MAYYRNGLWTMLLKFKSYRSRLFANYIIFFLQTETLPGTILKHFLRKNISGIMSPYVVQFLLRKAQDKLRCMLIY